MEKSIWNNLSPLPEMDLHRIYFLLFISITQYLFHLYLTLFSIVLFLWVWFIHYSDVQRSWTYPWNDTVYWIKFTCWFLSFPGGSDSKRICLQCKRPGFNPWVGKIPWRREWLLTPAFLPREFHGQKSLAGSSPRGHRVGDDWATFTFKKVII